MLIEHILKCVGSSQKHSSSSVKHTSVVWYFVVNRTLTIYLTRCINMHWQKIILCLKSMICHFQRILWTFYCIYYGLGDVFVVYCKDKVSQNLSPDNLYNPKLHSVESHPVLSKLKERERVLSVNTKFHPHQVSHMESCCKKIFCDVMWNIFHFHFASSH